MKYLVQDIETIPESEIASQWTPSQAEIERAKPRAPFPPIGVHKVICIGMLALDEALVPRKSGCAAGGAAGGKTEREMIERWSIAASGKMFNGHPMKLVDWNGRGFDMPVLKTRAFRLGVQIPWYFSKLPDNRGEYSSYSRDYSDRYKGWHIDVADAWTGHGAFGRPHMADLAQLMGLPGKTELDGSQVYDAFKAGKLAEIDVYCMQDVFQTAFVFQRIGYLEGRLDLEAYRVAAEALYHWIENHPEQAAFLAQIDRHALLLDW